jgi:hypothetical protein
MSGIFIASIGSLKFSRIVVIVALGFSLIPSQPLWRRKVWLVEETDFGFL